MSNREKFNQLVSKEKTDTLKKNKARIKNRLMLKESQKIALKVLLKLDQLGWTQKVLAEKMDVSPQYINKVVKGQENITLETQIKLQSLLNIPILASYFENKTKNSTEEVLITFNQKQSYQPLSNKQNSYTGEAKIINFAKKQVKDISYQEEM
ncbi:MAG: helix-turn-helix transcriptional regulator [Methylotenera sp.]|nr:helix-turn-helix transcriptional regulator [Flavobacterium sp.]